MKKAFYYGLLVNGSILLLVFLAELNSPISEDLAGVGIAGMVLGAINLLTGFIVSLSARQTGLAILLIGSILLLCGFSLCSANFHLSVH